jgi:hypothetical protein
MFLLLGAIDASPFIYVFLAPMGGTHSSHICRPAYQAAHKEGTACLKKGT